MPSVYTHYLLARRVLDALPTKTQNAVRPFSSAYYFGAQGADFAFFYKALHFPSVNFGSYLHRQGGYTAFSVLKDFACFDPFALAYALGYITHYAADVLFHPHVYALSKKSLLRHSRIEGAIDAILRAQYPPKNGASLRAKLTKTEIDELFTLYAIIAAKSGLPTLLKPAFTRAVKLFNAYTPLSFSVFYDTQPQILKNFAEGKTVDKLLSDALQYSLSLTEEFLQCVRARAPLPKAEFGKNYLSGK